MTLGQRVCCTLALRDALIHRGGTLITVNEYAREIDLGVVRDTGAPLPFLMANGHNVAVIARMPTRDPDWDGTYVTVVDPGSGATEHLAVIRFQGQYEVRFGGLNDEALRGHPLWDKGLRPYAAHEVINSSWIAEAERRNSVHPYHHGGWHKELTHYILCFHDETLECLAKGIQITTHVSSFRDLVRDVSVQVLG